MVGVGAVSGGINAVVNGIVLISSKPWAESCATTPADNAAFAFEAGGAVVVSFNSDGDGDSEGDGAGSGGKRVTSDDDSAGWGGKRDGCTIDFASVVVACVLGLVAAIASESRLVAADWETTDLFVARVRGAAGWGRFTG